MKKSQDESVECLSVRGLLLRCRNFLWAGLLPIWGAVLYFLPELLNRWLTPQELAFVLSVCSIMCLTLITWAAYLLIQLSNQLTCRFGLLWDSKNNPYCPTCKIPVRVDVYWNFGSFQAASLLCPKCGCHHPMLDDTGKSYDLSAIKKLL